MKNIHQKSDILTKEELKRLLDGDKFEWKKEDVRKVVNDESRHEGEGRQDRHFD